MPIYTDQDPAQASMMDANALHQPVVATFVLVERMDSTVLQHASSTAWPGTQK